jgi:hypothetical protein
VILSFGPGTYKISDELKIPPFLHLVGAGIDSTIIQQVGNAAVWRTVDSNSIPPNYTPFNSTTSSVRPRYIAMEGITFKTTVSNTVGYLDNTDFTSFKNVKFEGIHVYTSSPGADQIGIYIRSTGVLETANVLFDFCQWVNTGYGIFSNSNSGNISIRNCYFYQLWDGINIGGGTTGAKHSTITGCYFDLIFRYGLYIKKGIGNTSANNKYINVGNLNQNYVNATYPIIRFDYQNNLSTDDYFERAIFLKDQDQAGTSQFVPSIQGLDLIRDNSGFTKTITETLTAIEFYRFPVYDSGIYLLDYVINKGPTNTAIRSGQIRVSVDLRNELVSMSDSYDYTGSSTVENIVFSVSLADYSDTSDGIMDTLILRMYNPIGNGGAISNHSFKMLTQGNA